MKKFGLKINDQNTEIMRKKKRMKRISKYRVKEDNHEDIVNVFNKKELSWTQAKEEAKIGRTEELLPLH